MTSQEKKSYLNRFKLLDLAINQKIEECEKWHCMAEKITSSFSDMPKSQSGTSKTELAVENIICLESEINQKIDTLVDLRRNIEKSLCTISEDRLRALLIYRYIDGLTWEKIAVKMDCSYQWVCILHGRALKKLRIVDSN